MKYVIALSVAILLAGSTSYKLHTNDNLVAYAEKYGGFGYEYVAPYFTITSYSGTNANVIIPPDINGTNVTSIGRRAFDYCTGLTSKTIPNSVTNIGRKAFFDCSGLTSIPNSGIK